MLAPRVPLARQSALVDSSRPAPCQQHQSWRVRRGMSVTAARHPLMNVNQLKRYCRKFPGAAETLYGDPWNFLVYTIGGRKFAYFKTSAPERWRFSMKVAPGRFIELTDVPGVKPARYRGRYGWITIVNVSAFPANYLEELVASSYRRAFDSLSKAKQSGIGAIRPAAQQDATGDVLWRR